DDERPGQVDADDVVPLLERHLVRERVLRDPRVVREHVDAPEAFLRLRDGAGDARLVGDVAREGEPVRRRLGLAQIERGDLRALVGEAPRRRAAQTARRARHDRDAAFQSSFVRHVGAVRRAAARLLGIARAATSAARRHSATDAAITPRNPARYPSRTAAATAGRSACGTSGGTVPAYSFARSPWTMPAVAADT